MDDQSWQIMKPGKNTLQPHGKDGCRIHIHQLGREILALHPSIRNVVLSTVRGEILLSESRKGAEELPEQEVSNVLNM